MSRYNYTYMLDDECTCYLESTPEEDKLDEIEDDIAIDFTGNGYLHFWSRCKRAVFDLPRGGKSTIVDTYTGDEKIW